MSMIPGNILDGHCIQDWPLFCQYGHWFNFERWDLTNITNIANKECFFIPVTIWLFNSLPWKNTMLFLGKPSISMGHIFHGYVK